MSISVLSALTSSLTKGDVLKSVELMRAWLASAAPGEPEAMLAECSKTWRPKIALLMRDLLARYPATIIGAPVLFYFTEEEAEDGQTIFTTPPQVHLPFPPMEHSQPCADLHFLGWLPIASQLPLRLPFRPEQHTVVAPLHQIFTAVALFRSHPEVFDYDTLELPNIWWGELFRSVNANLHLSARMLLPYPDALEAARVLQASATGTPIPDRNGFLSDNGWAWAIDAGVLFHESCRKYFPTDAI